jgi:hypothetical protein
MRNRSLALIIAAIAAIAAMFAVYAQRAGQGPSVAQSEPGGTVVRPPSSIEKPSDVGTSAHTNVEIFSPKSSQSLEPPPKEFYERGNRRSSPDAKPDNPESPKTDH